MRFVNSQKSRCCRSETRQKQAWKRVAGFLCRSSMHGVLPCWKNLPSRTTILLNRFGEDQRGYKLSHIANHLVWRRSS